MLKINKVIKDFLLVFGLLFLILCTYYIIEIKPEVRKINSLISFNENYISDIKKNPEKLFENKYTDEDFERDYQLFSEIYKFSYDKKNEENLKEYYPSSLWTKVMFNFYSIIYLNKVYPSHSYDELLNVIVIIPKKSLSIENVEERDKIIVDNKKFKRENFSYTDFMVLDSMNSGLFSDKYYYNDVVKAFDNKYGNNSIIKEMMVKSADLKNPLDDDYYSIDDKDFTAIKESKALNIKIGEAFKNNNKEKLKIYFKQAHEYISFLKEFDFPFYQDLYKLNHYDFVKRNIALQIVLYENDAVKKENMDEFNRILFLSRYVN